MSEYSTKLPLLVGLGAIRCGLSLPTVRVRSQGQDSGVKCPILHNLDTHIRTRYIVYVGNMRLTVRAHREVIPEVVQLRKTLEKAFV